MTGSFGARLRRQRESQHITITHIAAVTKIQASLFVGLERDDVSRWPSGIFRRAFVRAYADQIGLDPDAVCREFVERFPDPGTSFAIPAVADLKAHLAPPPPMTPPAGTGAVGAASSSPTLRLTFADTPMTHAVARFLPNWAGRGLALTCDALVPLAVALTAFVVIDRFWMPLAIAALAYCLGSLLIFRTTPCLWLLAPGWRVSDAGTTDAPLADDEMVYPPVDINRTRARA